MMYLVNFYVEQLLCFVGDFLSYRSFKISDTLLKKADLKWKDCVGIYTNWEIWQAARSLQAHRSGVKTSHFQMTEKCEELVSFTQTRQVAEPETTPYWVYTRGKQ